MQQHYRTLPRCIRMCLMCCSRAADQCSNTIEPYPESSRRDACLRVIGSDATESAAEHPATDDSWYVATATVSSHECHLIGDWSGQSEYGRSGSADAAADSCAVVNARYVDVGTECEHSWHGHRYADDGRTKPTRQGMASECYARSEESPCSQAVSSSFSTIIQSHYLSYSMSTL